MMYRRYYVPGGCYFFTVVTENRRKILTLPSSYVFLQEAFDKVKQDRPFVLEAIVILPDHLHCIWKLPPGDFDFSTRWRLIKTRFTKQYRSSRSSESQRKHFQKKNQKKVWQNRYWEHFLRDEVITVITSITFISTLLNMVTSNHRPNGLFPVSTIM